MRIHPRFWSTNTSFRIVEDDREFAEIARLIDVEAEDEPEEGAEEGEVDSEQSEGRQD